MALQEVVAAIDWVHANAEKLGIEIPAASSSGEIQLVPISRSRPVWCCGTAMPPIK